jgi:hypothetical protein
MFFYDFVGVKFTNDIIEGKEITLGINPKIRQFLAADVRLIK